MTSRCLHDCLEPGEAPFASHLLYTQPGVLCDGVANEREQEIKAGLAWAERAQATIVLHRSQHQRTHESRYRGCQANGAANRVSQSQREAGMPSVSSEFWNSKH
jgi:hypothetical protein